MTSEESAATTSAVVYKYPLGQDGAVQVPWGPRSRVVLVAAQRPEDPTPTVWVQHNPAEYGGSGSPSATFMVQPTGLAYSESEYEWVGSAVCAHGALVWHVLRGLSGDR